MKTTNNESKTIIEHFRSDDFNKEVTDEEFQEMVSKDENFSTNIEDVDDSSIDMVMEDFKKEIGKKNI